MGRPITFQQWWARQGTHVMGLAGARHSGWNGDVYELEAGPGAAPRLSGPAPDPQATGTQPIRLSARFITGLQRMFAEPYDDRAQPLYAESLQELLREQAYLLRTDPHHDAVAVATQLSRPSSAMFEIGVNEWWTRRSLEPYRRASGLTSDTGDWSASLLSPGRPIIARPYHEEEVAGMRWVVHGLARQTGKRVDEVLDLLVQQTPDGKVAAAAALMLDHNPELAEIAADDSARQQAVARIGEAMREPFDSLSGVR